MRHFLSKDPFGLYLARIYSEWQQAKDEGREVEVYKEACEKLQERFKTASQEELMSLNEAALHLHEILISAPVREDHPYFEPSDWQEIVKESKLAELHDAESTEDDKELLDHLLGGWTGNAAGCFMGKPIEFMYRSTIREMFEATNNYPVSRYPACAEFTPELTERLGLKTGVLSQPWVDECDGKAFPMDDDTNYTVLNLKVAETYGLQFEPNDVLFAWLSWLPSGTTYTAERVAYSNAVKGLLAPDTARVMNPFREWIGALIRSASIGMLCSGKPVSAARMAFQDASVSHTRNGIYGEMMGAAMIAAAMTGADTDTVIETGLKVIPLRSRLHEALRQCIEDYRRGISFDEAVDHIHARYDEKNLFDWCHTIPNAMILVLSLLYGEGDFGKSISLSTLAGFDTDSTSAIVGAIVGAQLGHNAMPKYWGDIMGNRLRSSVVGYEDCSLSELAEKTLKLIRTGGEVDDRVKKKFDYMEQFSK